MAGFDSLSLSNYTVENAGELKTIALFAPKSMDLFDVKIGIKSSEKFGYLDYTPQMQAGGTCASINPSGSTSIAQITLTPDEIKYEDSWCLRDLEPYFTQQYLRAGSNMDESYATEIMNQIFTRRANRIAALHESAIWQSSKTQGGSDTNYKQFNGFIQTLETVGGYVNSNTSSETSITTSNVITIFNNHWLSVPSAMKDMDGLVTVCGYDTFDKLIIALVNANLYHYSGQEQANRTITLPGTNMKIMAVAGLNSDNVPSMPALFKNRIFTFYKDNLLVGTDGVSDLNQWETWYEKKDQKLYSRVEFRLTTGVYFPEHVVSFKTA
jgi:hypothetical protein